MPMTLRRLFLPVSLLVALLAGLTFLPGLPGSFVFDDTPNILNNESLKIAELNAESLINVASTQQLSGYLRVLPTLTFAVDYWRASDYNPATFKITNILIHALTALILAWFFRGLLLTAGVDERKVRWAAAALALAWAVHPLQVSSVLYVVQRMQTMSTLFLVLALSLYLKARREQILGRAGRTYLLLAMIPWLLSLGCKEDALLLPAYTLALELTILRFAAEEATLARRWRRLYLVASILGSVLFLLVVIPKYWSWEAYAARNFSTPERLLTQARVLCMYLWQIVLPMPSHMPFYYDWLQPSRGLLQPWTTLPAIGVITCLLGTAWWLRHRAVLFSLGIFLFFSAHFMTSNVIGLELAFEHRNHFALIGAVLAIGSLLTWLMKCMQLRSAMQTGIVIILLLVLGGTTLVRAKSWNSILHFAQANATFAPDSARAQVLLCSTLFDQGGGAVSSNPLLDKAIAACKAGTHNAPYALNNPALLIVVKTVRGLDTTQDWRIFQRRLETADMTWENQRATYILTYNMQKNGVQLDKQQILLALKTLARRANLPALNLASIGYLVMDDLHEPDLAIPYFIAAINQIPPYDPYPQTLAAELEAKGRPDLSKQIEQLQIDRIRKAQDIQTPAPNASAPL